MGATQSADSLRERQDQAWRNPADAVTRAAAVQSVDPRALAYTVKGGWWSVLERLDMTLLVSREYEHILLALRCGTHGPKVTYFPLPHPSGVVADRSNGRAYVASTRNPNQVYEFAVAARVLMPRRSWFLPGRLYIHDLALIGDELFANAVGENSVVNLPPEGGYVRCWWPRVIDSEAGPRFGPNHLQLNSIAAGASLRESFFSASTDTISRRRPGHQNFAVNRRGVIFSGATREPLVRGLTRPHSARLHAERVWVDNSGYGEFGVACEGRYEPITRFDGWTRGLAFCEDIAFVGTSRVLDRFRQYAPGVDSARSECALHAIDWRTGHVLGSLHWPQGNQIFAIDWLPSAMVGGLPFGAKSSSRTITNLFYTYESG